MRLISTSKAITIIGYPGGKSLQSGLIREYFPSDITEMASPFTGGGGVELASGQAGVRVWGADAFEPLVNFWQCVLEYPTQMADRVEAHLPFFDRSDFYSMRDGYFDVEEPIERAVRFFILNRASFSGTTFCGGFSESNFGKMDADVEKLRNFRAPNLSVSLADYRETIARHRDKFLYLDPPYPNAQSLYGKDGKLHNDFNHEELAAELKTHDCWLMSYCDTPEIRELYAGYEFIPMRWKYASGAVRNRVQYGAELLIRNVAEPYRQPDLFLP